MQTGIAFSLNYNSAGIPYFFGKPKNIFGNLEFNFGNLLKMMSIIAII